MTSIFISYRRDDSAASAGRLYDRLAHHFGKEQVFRDLDAIAPGAEFLEVIEDRIAQCNVLVAVIGKNWVNIKNVAGQRRLDDPKDAVRTEIREALNQKKLIIPTLIGGAEVPIPEELPEDIAALVGRNAIEITESRFDYDAGRVIEAIEKAGVTSTQKEMPPPAPQGPWAVISNRTNQRTWKFIGSGIAVLVGAVWTLYTYFSDKEPAPASGPTVTASGGGIAAGRDVQIAGRDINIGLSPLEFEEWRRKLKEEALAELGKEFAKERQADQEKIAALELKIQKASADLESPEEATARYNAILASADKSLQEIVPDVPESVLGQARELLFKGDTAKAEQLFEQALGTDTKRAAEAAFQLGELALGRIDYIRARKYYLEAVRLQPENADYVNKAGKINHEMGRYSEALTFYQKARAIREKSLGPNHPDVGVSLNNLAGLYHDLGLYAKAEPLLQRSLELMTKAHGPDHPDVAVCLNNLATLYYTQGEYAKAEPLYQRSLKIGEKTYGPDHPHVAVRLNNLAKVYYALGQYAKAEPLFLGSLKIFEKKLGSEHPHVATNLSNLAGFYYTLGEYAKAEPLYLRALKIREKAFGPEHPDVAASLNNLATLHYAQGHYAMAEPLYQRSLQILEKVLGPDHPHVAANLNNLAELYQEQGQYGKAEPLYQRSLKIWEKALGPEHPHVAVSLNNLAALYYNQQQYAKAEPLFQRSLKIWEKSLGPDHPDVANALKAYADLLDRMGRAKEAASKRARGEVVRKKHELTHVTGNANK
ncbi:tetratricopeptide repeat protein [Nitrosospira briensis]|uniref:tetratricopeptide repeat protein n=1 Tax=Nitrosospira briensis TaxID=35799 RepID=UPI0008DF62B2|nr:toll/interleukin-1 receptor domain-containing protein [Nitrosospira briensis]SFO36981.1 Tetratricopeptide repeat-containing protein [Nitrosospira briensis]